MSNDDLHLVLGATGTTGRRVAACARVAGLRVRAASRSSEARFDWSDADTWAPVLDGVTAAYVVAPYEPGPVHGFVERAADAGVRRLVLLSGHGADRWGDSAFGRDMRSAEDAVRGSSLEWTVLRPANFFQNFTSVWHGPLVDGELALPVGAAPEPFIDVEDVAEAAVTVLSEPGRHAGGSHELTGPRAITFAEAVDLVARATGRPLTYRRLSPDAYVAQLVAQGWNADTARHETAMYDLIDSGAIAETTDGVAALLGRPPRTFEDFVVRSAAAGAWR